MKITTQLLQDLSACTGGKAAFKQAFKGKAKTGVEITPDTIERFYESTPEHRAHPMMAWLVVQLGATQLDENALHLAEQRVVNKCNDRQQVELSALWELLRKNEKQTVQISDNFHALIEEAREKFDAEYVALVAEFSKAIHTGMNGGRHAYLQLQIAINSAENARCKGLNDKRIELHQQTYGSDAYRELIRERNELDAEIYNTKESIRAEEMKPYYATLSDMLNKLLESRVARIAEVTTVKIDWSTAPAMANWHAFNSEGRGAWYTQQPHKQTFQWFTTGGFIGVSDYIMPANVDWKETLTQRPAA